jgi:hypothetical protein
MRNIRLFVEFASIVMPGAVLLLTLSLLFEPQDWLMRGFPGSGLGLVAGVVFAFAAGHLLQGFSQLAAERVWPRTALLSPAEWAIGRFAGRERDRYLTVEQIEQLESQYPAKLGIPFPAAGSVDANRLESVVAHAEAYLYSAKVSERLDDLHADYRLNKGLFNAFLLICLCVAGSLPGWLPVTAGAWAVPALAASAVAALCFYVRTGFYSRKYAQTLFLQFLATNAGAREGGGGKGEGGGGGGAGGGGLPRSGGRGGAQQPDDEDAA